MGSEEIDPNNLDLEDDDDQENEVEDDDNDDVSEGEKAKILADLEKDEDEEVSSGSSNEDHESGGLSNVKDDDESSLLTEDIANRSLNAEDEDAMVIIDPQNYLKFTSDKFNI